MAKLMHQHSTKTLPNSLSKFFLIQAKFILLDPLDQKLEITSVYRNFLPLVPNVRGSIKEWKYGIHFPQI